MAVCAVDDGYADARAVPGYTADGYGSVGIDELAYGHPGTFSYHDGLLRDGGGVEVLAGQPWPGSGMSQQYWPESSEAGEFGTEWQGPGGGNWPGANLPGMDMQGAQRAAAGGPSRQKRRFCTSFPEVSLCRRGGTCAFAHSREEIRAPLLEGAEERQDPAALTDEFLMYKYKTLWCPIGVQHEWHTCVYAHNYQDARRPVSIGYGARLCPYWNRKDTCAEYSQRCPLGLRCPFAHGAKEQLYHPQYFKTVICRDLRNKACPRHSLCAFFHHRAERRAPPADDVDYSQPLSEEALPEKWVGEFLSPPFTPENGRGDEQGMPGASGPGDSAIASYSSQDAAQYPQCAMQPTLFFLLPATNMNSPMAHVAGGWALE